MEKKHCYLCQKTKANLTCGLCAETICKSCTRFLNEDRFSFLKPIPKQLSHTTYCEPCFHNTVEPEFEKYDDVIQQAKSILVFSKTQGKETRLVKRLEDQVRVDDCADEDETILRLAFFAAQAGYNAIVDVDVTSEKVRTNNYQTLKWTGTAIPAHVMESKLIKDRSMKTYPN
jgi:hypothetical protein